MGQKRPDVNRFGLTQVAGPVDAATATGLHIVFVHGLRGDPERTWLKKPETFWPQTLLPSQFRDAYIHTYGYDADVERLSSWMSSGRNSIHQHARNLMTDLANLLDATDHKSQSIIFVAHSLGGIVVKDALNQSSQTDQEHRRRVATSTIGVCFMGTPHRGSSAANLARNLLPVSYAFLKRPNWRVVSSLEPESEKLDSVADAFVQTIKRHDIDIYTFYEERAYGFGLVSKVLVDANSAKIGDIREEIASIPADHKEMARFGSTSDIGYQRLSAALTRCQTRRRESHYGHAEDFEDCRASLHNMILCMRFEDIKASHDKTFHWLYDDTQVSFSGWLRGDAVQNPMYWIQGKPGSGKSTLMKFAMRDKRTPRKLSQSSKDSWILVGFFFHDRGVAAQKSLHGMLHGILYQVLTKAPALFGLMRHLFTGLSREQRSRTPAWDIATLRAALFAIVAQREVATKICLFIDALDEHSGDKDQLAELLHELAKSGNEGRNSFKICVASRSWNVFEQQFGRCPNLAIHDHTINDIEVFTKETLFRVIRRQDGASNEGASERVDHIASTVTLKARGVFIWVKLVVDDLADGLRNGTPFFVLEKKLADIPQELGDLYRHTLERIDPRHALEGEMMLSLVTCAMWFLQLKTLDCCTSHTLYQRTGSSSETDMRRRLSSRTGGLLEVVVLNGDGTKEDHQYVQPIHQTVKDFLQKTHDIGLKDEKGFPVPRSNGHLSLIKACTSCYDGWTETIRPDIFNYAQILETSGTDMPLDVFDILDGQLHHLWNKHQYRGATQFSMAKAFGEYSGALDSVKAEEPRLNIVMAVAANLKSYVRSHIDRGLPLTGTPCLLQVAALGPRLVENDYDRVGMVRLLLEAGYPPDYLSNPLIMVKYMDTPEGDDRDVANRASIAHFKVDKALVTTLFSLLNLNFHSYLRLSDRHDIMKCLLSHGANPDFGMKPIYESHEDVWTPIDLCVYYGDVRSLELLLEYKGHSPENSRLRTFARLINKYWRSDDYDTRITPWVVSWLLSQPWRTFSRETWWPAPHDPNLLPRPVATTLTMASLPALFAGAAVCPETVLVPTQAHMLKNFARHKEYLHTETAQSSKGMELPGQSTTREYSQAYVDEMPIPTLWDRLTVFIAIFLCFVSMDWPHLGIAMMQDRAQRRKLKAVKDTPEEIRQPVQAG